jgi:large subunit ribosomal protein L28
MSKVCDLTGKRAIKGNHVSHSNVKTKRRFNPNLQLKKFYIPESGEWITLKVSTSAIRTIAKNGMGKVVRDFLTQGKV